MIKLLFLILFTTTSFAQFTDFTTKQGQAIQANEIGNSMNYLKESTLITKVCATNSTNADTSASSCSDWISNGDVSNSVVTLTIAPGTFPDWVHCSCSNNFDNNEFCQISNTSSSVQFRIKEASNGNVVTGSTVVTCWGGR